MNFTKKSSGIFKQGGKVQKPGNIVIGGMDEDLLSERRNQINELAIEAEEKASKKIGQLTIDAQKQAEEIVSTAQAEAESIEKQAYDKGYQAGQKQAEQDFQDHIKSTLEEVAQILKAIEKERQETLAGQEAEIYKIITLISKKLLNKELELSKFVCLRFIKQAIAELDYKARITLTVNPKIGEILNRDKLKLLSEYPEVKQLFINTDAQLNKGDLILESNKERFDHRLETKLEQLLTEMLKPKEQ